MNTNATRPNDERNATDHSEAETPADRWADVFARNRDMVESVDRELQDLRESEDVDRGRGIMTDGGEDYSDEERAFFGIDELRHVSDGGLQIMKSHLQEAYDRIGRAADRDDHIDLNDPAGREGAPSSDMLGAAALINQTIDSIDRELDSRDDGDDVDRGDGPVTDGGEDVDRTPAERFPTDGVTFEVGGFAWVDPRGLADKWANDGATASQGVTITDVHDGALTVEYPGRGETKTTDILTEYVRETDLSEGETVTFNYDSSYSENRVSKTGEVASVHRTRRSGFDGIYVDVDGTRYQIRATGGVKTYGPVERPGGDSTVRRIGRDAVVTRVESDDVDRGDGPVTDGGRNMNGSGGRTIVLYMDGSDSPESARTFEGVLNVDINKWNQTAKIEFIDGSTEFVTGPNIMITRPAQYDGGDGDGNSDSSDGDDGDGDRSDDETDRRLRTKRVAGTRHKFSHPVKEGQWIEGTTQKITQ